MLSREQRGAIDTSAVSDVWPAVAMNEIGVVTGVLVVAVSMLSRGAMSSHQGRGSRRPDDTSSPGVISPVALASDESVEQLPRWLGRRLNSAELAFEPPEPARLSVGLVLALVGGVLLIGVAPTVGAIAATALGAAALVAIRQGRAERRYEADLPDALDHVVRALRSGASLTRSLSEAATASTHQVRTDLAWLGTPTPANTLQLRLEQWPSRRPIGAVRFIATALSLGHDSGAGQAVALDGAASSLRDRLEAHAELRAQSVQSRSSAAVITLAPLGFLALTTLIDPRVPRFLSDTTIGRTCLVAGLLLDGLAATAMARMTSRTVDS